MRGIYTCGIILYHTFSLSIYIYCFVVTVNKSGVDSCKDTWGLAFLCRCTHFINIFVCLSVWGGTCVTAHVWRLLRPRIVRAYLKKKSVTFSTDCIFIVKYPGQAWEICNIANKPYRESSRQQIGEWKKKCLCKSLLSVKEDSSCLCLSLLCIVSRFFIYGILSDLDGGSWPRELLVCNS